MNIVKRPYITLLKTREIRDKQKDVSYGSCCFRNETLNMRKVESTKIFKHKGKVWYDDAERYEIIRQNDNGVIIRRWCLADRDSRMACFFYMWEDFEEEFIEVNDCC
jgi:hypothetical protein